MQALLRPIGNSVGVILSASVLKALSAEPGDTVELEIKRIIPALRQGWENPALWQGASDEPLHLSDSANAFDQEEWQW